MFEGSLTKNIPIGKAIQCFTVVIHPKIAKKYGHHNMDLISVKVDEIAYPALLYINEKAKGNYSFVDNGCVPSGFASSQFSISIGFDWLFIKTVTLSPQSVCMFTSENININYETEKYTPFDLSEFEDIKKLQTFICNELVSKGICFKIGMTISVIYLSKNYTFKVENVSPYFYELTESDKFLIGYKCFHHASVEFLDKKGKLLDKENAYLEMNHFGGYTSQIQELFNQINQLLETGKTNTSGILITGPPGCGKTMIGNILTSLFIEKCIKIQAEDIVSSYIGKGEAILKNVFRNLKTRSPAFLFIDDIDELCRDRDKGGNLGIVNALLHLLDGVMEGVTLDTMVICTVTHLDILDPALRRPGRLSHDIILSIPTEEERFNILEKIFNRSDETIGVSDLKSLAAKTPGFTGGDLMRLVTETYSHADQPSLELFLDALKTIKPSSLRNMDVSNKKVCWGDISGYSDLKSSMIDLFKLTLNHKEFFVSCGITPPSRFLLFGPTGCCKTLMVQALANEFNLALIPVKRSNIFGKYFGESEKNLTAIFNQAKKSSPCIVHFENFEGIAGRKMKDSETTSDVEERVITHLKVLLDGVIEYENIFIIAETNRPDLLDKFVIRHGRFHRYFYFDLPSEDERRLLIGNILQDKTTTGVVEKLTQETQGFTMASVKLFSSEIRKNLENSQTDSDLFEEETLLEMLDEIQERVPPKTSARMIKKYFNFKSIYCEK